MTPDRKIKIYDRFEYHMEDLDCTYCLHRKRKSKNNKSGCKLEACPYMDIAHDATANGRVRRKSIPVMCENGVCEKENPLIR